MNSIPRCLITGIRFSPAAFQSETKILLTNTHEPGEIAKTGRYKGRALPYGAATLLVPKENDLADDVAPEDWMLLTIETSINSLRLHGAEDIVFHIDVVYSDQCNLEFSPDFLVRLASLKIPFTISCYQKSSAED